MEKIMMRPPVPGTPYVVQDGQVPQLLKEGWWEPSDMSTVPTTDTENPPEEATINVNTASLSALTSLPGIGASKGRQIIENRPYAGLDDLGALDIGVDWSAIASQLSY